MFVKELSLRRDLLHRCSWIILIVGGIGLTLILSAMALYPREYRFFHEYLSAMGRTVIDDGAHRNWIACIVFNSGLVLSGTAVGFYFLLRGLHDFSAIGRLLAIAGSCGGLMLSVTGLCPFDLLPDAHNISIGISCVLVTLSLVLCGLQRRTLFADRSLNLAFLGMTIYIAGCWWTVDIMKSRIMIISGGVMQQKLMVFYLWFFMIFHAILLICNTRSESK